MKILFDNGVPRNLALHLKNRYDVVEARAKGWDRLGNGDLIRAAETEGFEIIVTTDKNLQYQQNIKHRRIAVVILGQSQWPRMVPYLPQIENILRVAEMGSFVEIAMPAKK